MDSVNEQKTARSLRADIHERGIKRQVGAAGELWRGWERAST